MIAFLVVVGAFLGLFLLQEEGLVIGAILGGLVAWCFKLNETAADVQKRLLDVEARLKRLAETTGEAPHGAAPGAEEALTGEEAPEARASAAKAFVPAAKSLSEGPASMEAAPPEPEAPPPPPVPPQPAVPPAAEIPPAPVVPPATRIPPSEVEQPAARVRPPAASVGPPPEAESADLPQDSVVSELFRRFVLGGNPLVKIGVVVLFFGLAFALRYAAELGLLPLWLRYCAVAATGAGLLVFGWRWRLREDNYGLILQGAGFAVLYLTTLAAMRLHPLLPLGAGFALLFLIAAFAAFLAVTENAVVMAVVAALGGFAAPVFASSGDGSHVILFSYLTVLNAGIVGIAWFRRWRILNIIGYVCSFSLGGAWAAGNYRDELFWTTEPFLLLLFVIYVVITMLFARRTLVDAGADAGATYREQVRRAPKEMRYVDGSLAFGVPFSTFWVQHLLVGPYQYGTALSAAGMAAFYFLVAFWLIKTTGKRYRLLEETLIAIGAVFGTLSIPLLETPWTATAWAVEAAGVYWVGYRQKQAYVRYLALLVLLGSVVYFLPEIRLSSEGPILDGPILSAALLSLATGFVYWLMWREEAARLEELERYLRPLVVCLGASAFATLPLMLFTLEWASAALAIAGVGYIYLSRSLSDPVLLLPGWAYQLIGGMLFLATLETAAGGVVIASSWLGLLSSSLIGFAMIMGAAIAAVERPGLPGRNGLPNARLPVNVALLAGLAFLNLAPLFVLPWRLSAMIWPVVGVATLLWAVRRRHRGVLLFSLALQLVAGIVHLGTWADGDVVVWLRDGAPAFMHSGFLGPVIIAFAGLACARLMQQRGDGHAGELAAGWLAIVWGGCWWAFGWTLETLRVLPVSAITAFLLAVTLATAFSLHLLARRLEWAEIGRSAVVYLAVLVILGLRDLLADPGHPGAGWGALAWPGALFAHGYLTRVRSSAGDEAVLAVSHAAGALLFVVLASFEVHWWLGQWSPPATTWPLLGHMLAGTAYLAAVSRPPLNRLWPVAAYFRSYVLAAALPIVAYLLAWLWATNLTSNGEAGTPVYVPVFNPLELAYLAVMASLYVWWRLVRARDRWAQFDTTVNSVFAVTAFAAVTGGVVRACHHWAQIPWKTDMLLASDTVQTSLSVAWGTLAISLMILGNRRKYRAVWITGAALVGVVVVKLFLVELSAVGTMQRIVSFVVVGLLLLLVGFIAPLPPRASAGRPAGD